jgi:signal transduction histidine kinase
MAAAVERCQASARSHGLTLVLDGEARKLHAAADVGRDLASRCLTNLIRNSIQHAPPSTTVSVSARLDKGRVCVRVEDAGVALTEENRQRAFTAEGQVEAKVRAHTRYSRGMGLYCARVAARLCGAEIVASGSPGERGNVFELWLPLVPSV